MDFRLRPYTNDDQLFLFQLYADTRRQEVSGFGWDAAQQDAFLRMQFNAQQRSYEMAYPDAEHEIVVSGDVPIGRMLVMHGKDAKVLVDIALLSNYRGQGMGGKLVGALLEHSDRERVPVRLQVLRNNPARRLYDRLGFIQTGEDEMYFQMERKPK